MPGKRRRFRGLRSRLAATVLVVVLATSGGTALAVYLTLSSWLTQNAATTASYIFASEMEDLAAARPDLIARSELALEVEPDVTLMLDGSLLVKGSVDESEASRPAALPSGTGAEAVHAQVHGHRVTLSSVVEVTTRDGQTGVVVAYADRTLPGIKSGIITLGAVTGVSIAAAAAIALACAWWLGGRIVTPLRQLNAAASRSAAGQFDAELPDARIGEVADLAAGFNHMQREHAASLARRERFVSDVSHELRTPLAAMVPMAEILVEERDSMGPDARQAADVLAAEVQSLAALVEDLIEISRHDSASERFAPTRQDVVALLRGALASRGWSDEVTLSGSDQVVVDVDGRRLEIAVTNLVANALHHGAPPVDVHVAAQSGVLRIQVSDHGPGIEDVDRARVFERFVKADSARTRGEGSGLGLALVRANVALHGGTVEVTSLRRPTVFTMTIPLRAGS